MIRVTLPLLMLGIAFGGETHKFSHFQHVKTEELVCSDCHGKTMNSTTLPASRVGLTLKSCDKCHSDDSAFRTEKAIELSDPSFLVKRAEGDLKFNHKSHRSAKVECATCHGELVEKLDSGAAPAPAGNLLSMQTCMDCHMQKADISCLSCHDKLDKPLDHMSALWLRSAGHGMQANLNDKDCAMCHEKGEIATCDDCHKGSDARVAHGLNYRFNHGIDVKFKKMDCSVCHAPLDQFCADCHEGKGRQLR